MNAFSHDIYLPISFWIGKNEMYLHLDKHLKPENVKKSMEIKEKESALRD